MTPSTQPSTVQGDGGIMGVKRKGLRIDYRRDNVNIDTFDSKTELDKYLSDKPEPDDDERFDILDWWSAQRKTYPILMKMARDVLAIPVSTVASKSAFSTRGRVLDSFCTSLTPRMVEALICSQDWMRSSTEPFSIEENLLKLETLEEGMTELVLEQPLILIDENESIALSEITDCD